jgi:chromosomal replication initiation ATPase DnaA
MEEFIRFIGKKFGVTGEEIIGGSQRWTVAEARSVFCYLGSRELGITRTELSRALGLTPAGIHKSCPSGSPWLSSSWGY